MSCCLASHVGVMTQRAQTGHVGLRMVALEWLFFSLSSDKCVVMFYITLTVDWTICSGFSAHVVQIGITRRSQSKVDRPTSIPYCRTPWLHLSHGALAPCRNADRETQSMQTLCLHHYCYHNTSSHHYFLPRPWCSSLLTGLPVSALVPPLSHSPASSENECFRTSQMMSLLIYNPPTVSHFPENRNTHLWNRPASSHMIFTFTHGIQKPVFFQSLSPRGTDMCWSLCLGLPHLFLLQTSLLLCGWLWSFRSQLQCLQSLHRGLFWASNPTISPPFTKTATITLHALPLVHPPQLVMIRLFAFFTDYWLLHHQAGITVRTGPNLGVFTTLKE